MAFQLMPSADREATFTSRRLFVRGTEAFNGPRLENLDGFELPLLMPSVPEPTTLTLFATGLAGLGFMMRRRRRGTSLAPV